MSTKHMVWTRDWVAATADIVSVTVLPLWTIWMDSVQRNWQRWPLYIDQLLYKNIILYTLCCSLTFLSLVFASYINISLLTPRLPEDYFGLYCILTLFFPFFLLWFVLYTGLFFLLVQQWHNTIKTQHNKQNNMKKFFTEITEFTDLFSLVTPTISTLQMIQEDL